MMGKVSELPSVLGACFFVLHYLLGTRPGLYGFDYIRAHIGEDEVLTYLQSQWFWYEDFHRVPLLR